MPAVGGVARQRLARFEGGWVGYGAGSHVIGMVDETEDHHPLVSSSVFI